MSESAKPVHDPRARKKKGCLWLLLFLGIVCGLILLVLPILSDFLMTTRCGPTAHEVIIKDLRVAISSYYVEYNRYPIPASVLSTSSGKDISTRSRGPMLPMLIGDETKPLIPLPSSNPKDVRFISLPKARNRMSGTWQDGDEWVLSDPWGEPYFIVLDTNNDNQTANPEFGADQSDPDYAKLCRASPPPPTLPLEILVYSSGPDRDPKTWQDNICSWRSR